MSKTAEEKINAMKILTEGKSLAEVSRITGIDRKTLKIYWIRYHEEGEAAFIAKRKSYSMDYKITIVNEILQKHKSPSLVAAERGIPKITINRWVATLQEKGIEGLNDERHNNPGSRRHISRNLLDKVIEQSLVLLEKYAIGEEVRICLEENNVFNNKSFRDFLDILFVTYQEYSKNSIGRNALANDSGYDIIYKAGYIFFNLHHNFDENEILDKLLEISDIKFYVSVYIYCCYWYRPTKKT